MSAILTAAQVEAVALEGRRELSVEYGTIVTPLAKDRAAALGIALVEGAAGSLPGSSGAGSSCAEASAPRPRRRGDRLEVDRLALESRVRILARRALLRQGQGLGQVEELLDAVIARLFAEEEPGPGCGCDGARR